MRDTIDGINERAWEAAMRHTGPLNVPNLDAMSADELMSFWARHQRGRGRKKLGLYGPGSVNTTGDLACYALNKAVAMRCRLEGNIETALMYEGIADRIYQRLPDTVKW